MSNLMTGSRAKPKEVRIFEATDEGGSEIFKAPEEQKNKNLLGNLRKDLSEKLGVSDMIMSSRKTQTMKSKVLYCYTTTSLSTPAII